MSFSQLPIELIQLIAFFFLDHPKDVLSLALCSKSVYGKLFGIVGDENEYDKMQHRAMTGVLHCLRMEWERAAELALKRGFGDPTESNNMSIIMAAKYGFSGVLRMLLKDRRCDPSSSKNAALFSASYKGNRECVLLLLEDERVNPTENNYRAIHSALRNGVLRIAAENGHDEIVAVMLHMYGANPYAREDQALILACRNGHVGVVQELLAYQPKTSFDIDRAMELALRLGQKEILALLMKSAGVNLES